MSRRTVKLHINQLLLQGYTPEQSDLIGRAIQQELQNQLQDQGVPAQLARPNSIARINAGTVQTKQGSTPEAIGKQVAIAVYGSVAVGVKTT